MKHNLGILPLRPLHALGIGEKVRLPVSVTITESGARIVISHYGNEVWDFWPYILHENTKDSNKRIYWNFKMPDGSRLTDPQHSGLLESCKDFIWSLFVDPVEGRKALTMQSLIHIAMGQLPHLVRWMSSRGLTKFSQLEGHTMDYVAATRHGVSPSTASKRLMLLEDLYHQATKISDALAVHPWPDESASALAGVTKGSTHRKPKTPRMPDQVVKELARHAMDYVQNRSGPLLDLLDAACADEDAAIARGVCRSQQIEVRSMVAKRAGFDGSSELNHELFTLRTACYIVIDMFSGIRDSEMMSLAAGCIVPGKKKDGIELLWLHGTIYKLGLRPHKWLVPPIVAEAVRVLERFSAPYRRRMEEEERTLLEKQKTAAGKAKEPLVKRLAKVRHQKDKLFLSEHKIDYTVSVLSAAGMRRKLKEFCEKFDIRGDDGEIWPLASHQFRRTFAYNYAKSEMGDLRYLQEHFGHRSLDMTLLYADGGVDGYEADVELLEEINRARAEHQADILTGIVDSDAPLAAGEQWIGDWRRTVRTAKNKEELIEALSGTLSLTGTGHSWCAGSAKGTGCGSRCMFEADMCTECNWAIISQEHLPVWREIALQQEIIINCNDIGLPGKKLAMRILGKAKVTIAKLEGRMQ